MRALHLAAAVLALACLFAAAPAAADAGSLALQENESDSPDVNIYGPETAVYNYSEEFRVSVLGADVESVTWKFPDGSTATGTETTYRFMEEGDRTITVVVETTDGETLRESVTYDVFHADDDDGWNPVPALQFFGMVGFFLLVLLGLKMVALPMILREL
ncbi:PKD domain-containing protein [Haloarchaeobius amylolyticus]|uniref:PKD domain-containing protein n=1 Tax=Haloarchaeobius amylolyticus TaxID=1198296 RepID=UPI00226DD81B|nr:PKD domain-containing protein [Haloarchaeobius amylolyticus]